jgi:hypothetical protein
MPSGLTAQITDSQAPRANSMVLGVFTGVDRRGADGSPMRETLHPVTRVQRMRSPPGARQVHQEAEFEARSL